MALIINGDMPKGCGWDCHYVAVNKYYDERDDKIHKCVFCALNHSIRYKDSGIPEEYEHTRHPNCPIIGEIPDSHGRLIDADALLPKSGYDPMMFKHKYDGDHRTQYDTLMGYEILGIVEDAPTIVEATE